MGWDKMAKETIVREVDEDEVRVSVEAEIVAWLCEIAGRPGGAARSTDARRLAAKQIAKEIKAGEYRKKGAV